VTGLYNAYFDQPKLRHYPQWPASSAGLRRKGRRIGIAELQHFWQVSVVLLVQTRVNLRDQSVPDWRLRFESAVSQRLVPELVEPSPQPAARSFC
jgi:hypothetical protein